MPLFACSFCAAWLKGPGDSSVDLEMPLDCTGAKQHAQTDHSLRDNANYPPVWEKSSNLMCNSSGLDACDSRTASKC